MKAMLINNTASSPSRVPFAQNLLLKGLVIAFSGFWITSFVGTTDLANWYIENILVVLFSVFLVATHRKFQFSNLSYVFIFLFLMLHTYGAKYAYADNPFGAWLQSGLHLKRNPYDRIVHTSFGLLMAYPIRDVAMNTLKLKGRMLWVLPVEIILSLAGLFELVEWSVADIFFPAHGASYVGTQGDIWDAQKDMVVALFGAIFISLVLYRIKRKVMAKVGNDNTSTTESPAKPPLFSTVK